eukprot:Opistho-2@71634
MVVERTALVNQLTSENARDLTGRRKSSLLDQNRAQNVDLQRSLGQVDAAMSYQDSHRKSEEMSMRSFMDRLATQRASLDVRENSLSFTERTHKSTLTRLRGSGQAPSMLPAAPLNGGPAAPLERRLSQGVMTIPPQLTRRRSSQAGFDALVQSSLMNQACSDKADNGLPRLQSSASAMSFTLMDRQSVLNSIRDGTTPGSDAYEATRCASADTSPTLRRRIVPVDDDGKNAGTVSPTQSSALPKSVSAPSSPRGQRDASLPSYIRRLAPLESQSNLSGKIASRPALSSTEENAAGALSSLAGSGTIADAKVEGIFPSPPSSASGSRPSSGSLKRRQSRVTFKDEVEAARPQTPPSKVSSNAGTPETTPTTPDTTLVSA